MRTVAIIDYGLCNLDSVARALGECGASAVVTNNPRDLETADAIILPGVGAFPDAMRNLRQHALDEALNEQVVGRGTPFLGICLGMQLMARWGEEAGGSEGLGWVQGQVTRLTPHAALERIPHVGWNEVLPVGDSILLKGIPSGNDFYFVHSFHVTAPADVVIATTPYCGGFTSVIEQPPMFGVQFHPEKSQRSGLAVLRNFLSV